MFDSDSQKWWLGIIAGFLIALVSSFVDTVVSSTTFKVLRIIGVIVGLYSGYSQWVTLRPFVLEFSSGDWVKNGNDGYSLKIPKTKHGKGSHPVFECFRKEKDGSFQVIGLHKSVVNGDVIFGAIHCWDGKAIVK